MLNSEGLLRYVDSRCVQRELSEAAGISEEEMDEVAHELLNMRQDDTFCKQQHDDDEDSRAAAATSGRLCSRSCWSESISRRTGDVESAVPTSKTGRPAYYEHLGGYEMDELKDYNEYSRRKSTVVARVMARGFHWLTGLHRTHGEATRRHGAGVTSPWTEDRPTADDVTASRTEQPTNDDERTMYITSV